MKTFRQDKIKSNLYSGKLCNNNSRHIVISCEAFEIALFCFFGCPKSEETFPQSKIEFPEDFHIMSLGLEFFGVEI